jgi:hypothetical protein
MASSCSHKRVGSVAVCIGKLSLVLGPRTPPELESVVFFKQDVVRASQIGLV